MLFLDINECTGGTDDCSTNAACTNTAGSFNCTCNSGFNDTLIDGTQCDGKKSQSFCIIFLDMNDCTAVTENFGNPFVIIFFYMSHTLCAYLTLCLDIDECTGGTDDCTANAACTNTFGGFTCSCKPGFNDDGSNTASLNCVAIIEATLETEHVLSTGGMCSGGSCTMSAHLLGLTLAKLYKVWRVEFEINPTGMAASHWTSIIRLTMGGNEEVYGDRTPLVLFHPGTTKTSYF